MKLRPNQIFLGPNTSWEPKRRDSHSPPSRILWKNYRMSSCHNCEVIPSRSAKRQNDFIIEVYNFSKTSSMKYSRGASLRVSKIRVWVKQIKWYVTKGKKIFNSV